MYTNNNYILFFTKFKFILQFFFYIYIYIQGLPKVWKPLNNSCKNENIKKRYFDPAKF